MWLPRTPPMKKMPSNDRSQYLSLCRFYHGEEQCPYRDVACANQDRRFANMATAWEYESWWVERPELHDSDESKPPIKDVLQI